MSSNKLSSSWSRQLRPICHSSSGLFLGFLLFYSIPINLTPSGHSLKFFTTVVTALFADSKPEYS